MSVPTGLLRIGTPRFAISVDQRSSVPCLPKGDSVWNALPLQAHGQSFPSVPSVPQRSIYAGWKGEA